MERALASVQTKASARREPGIAILARGTETGPIGKIGQRPLGNQDLATRKRGNLGSGQLLPNWLRQALRPVFGVYR